MTIRLQHGRRTGAALAVAEAMAMLPGQVERLSWTEEQLAAHRRDALRQLVRTAQNRSPWLGAGWPVSTRTPSAKRVWRRCR